MQLTSYLVRWIRVPKLKNEKEFLENYPLPENFLNVSLEVNVKGM